MPNNKLYKNYLVLGLVISQAVVSQAIAVPKQTADAVLQRKIEKIVNKRTAALQKEVASLRRQINHFNSKPSPTNHQKIVQRNLNSGRAERVSPDNQMMPGPVQQTQSTETFSPTLSSLSQASGQQTQDDDSYERTGIQSQREGVIEPLSQRALSKNYALNALFLGGYPVFTSPYIGIRSSYDGSELIINESTINLDVRLLRQTQALDKFLKKNRVPEPDHPVIEVSGRIEGQALYGKVNPGSAQADIDVNSAEFDIFAQLNKWALGFISMEFDNTRLLPFRVANSNLRVPRAFITLGNFAYSPLYFSIGQMRVPFGQFSSNFISSTLPQRLGRVTARAITLGFRPQDEKGFYAAAFAFKGDTRANRHRVGGVNVGYEYNNGDFSTTNAVAILSNIAESERMQLTGAPDSIPFQGFGLTPTTEMLRHGVPALDVRSTINYGKFGIIAEWVSATRGFDPLDMTFNGGGAKPAGLHIEGVYRFELDKKPGMLALGYDWTRQSLALQLPRKRYAGIISYSFVRNTIFSLEYRHDINYKSTDYATGAGSAPFGPLGSSVDQVTAQLGVYF